MSRKAIRDAARSAAEQAAAESAAERGLPPTDNLADLLVSHEPSEQQPGDLTDVGEAGQTAAEAARARAEEEARRVNEDQARKHAEEDEAARQGKRGVIDHPGLEDEDEDEGDDEESLPLDAVVLMPGTVLQLNGADVTLFCALPVILPGSSDEETLAAVLVRDRANFDLNKGLLSRDFNPMTGTFVPGPTEKQLEAQAREEARVRALQAAEAAAAEKQ